MQKIVECKLIVNRVVNDKEDKVVIEGKGYYKEDAGEKIVFFSSDDIKYKYVYKEDVLIVTCNDSKYVFRVNEKDCGEIKNGDYIFKITTLASKIEFGNNYVILDYSLYQNELIGTYYSQLSFN